MPGAAVQRDHVAGDAPFAELVRHFEQLVGGLVVGARHPGPVAPARRDGGAPGQPGVFLDDLGGIFADEEEEVEVRLLDFEDIAAVRPGRIADSVGDPCRRVHEDPPARGAPGKGGILIRELGVDAGRVPVPADDQLAAAVEGAEFFAQAVDRLAALAAQG